MSFIDAEMLEEVARGKINSHETIGDVCVAFGYENHQDKGRIGTAYIYNIPQDGLDREYLAVRASENGGSNPEVFEPSSDEYVLGMTCEDLTRDEMREVCTQTVKDINCMNVQPVNQQPTDTGTVIDLEDEF